MPAPVKAVALPQELHPAVMTSMICKSHSMGLMPVMQLLMEGISVIHLMCMFDMHGSFNQFPCDTAAVTAFACIVWLVKNMDPSETLSLFNNMHANRFVSLQLGQGKEVEVRITMLKVSLLPKCF